jgi:hypothetical protein
MNSMSTTSQFLKRLAPLLGATTLLVSTRAQNQATLTPIGQWPGYPLLHHGAGAGVTTAGSYAYLAGAGEAGDTGQNTNVLRVITVDVSTPSQPRYLHHCDAPVGLAGWAYTALQARGHYLYVLVGPADNIGESQPVMLAVLDLSSPAEPRFVGNCQFTGLGWDMDIVGNLVFLPAGRFGLRIIDVSDPSHPFLKGTCLPTWWHRCVAVSGNYAYAGGGVLVGPGLIQGRVDIIDISDPAHPFTVGGFDLGERQGVSVLRAEGSVLHLFYNGSAWEVPGGYQILDLSDPVNPSLIGSCELPSHEYVKAIRVVGNVVYEATSSGLRTLDISSLQNPQTLSFVCLENISNLGSAVVEVADQHAYWIAHSDLKVFGVKAPATPVQVGVFDNAFYRLRLRADGELAYLFEDDPDLRLRTVDVRNPRVPKLIGAQDHLGGLLGSGLNGLSGFEVVGSRGYVLGSTGRRLEDGHWAESTRVLQIVDLSDPQQPRELAFLEPFDYGGWSAVVVGNRAYVTGGSIIGSIESRLTVVDMTDPVAPLELGSLTLPDIASVQQVIGDYAYVQLYETDLVIVDIRDPSQLVEVGRYHPPNQLNGFQINGRYAYVFRSHPADTSVHVVDLVDPANPTRIGQYPYDAATVWLQALYVSGPYVFVTLKHQADPPGRHRVDILDVRDPTRPVKAGEYHSVREISGFAMVGNTLYTTSDAGLTILDFYAPNTSPNLRLNTPVLSGGVAVLTWEGGAGILLQKTASLTASNWEDVPGTLGQSVAVLPQTSAAAFFRLVMP